ncbi:MAG: response regulator transcription factor [Bacteroidota bacterium]
MKKTKKLLLVEDDENLGFVIKDNLEERGYQVVHARDGRDGYDCFNRFDFNLCLLDIMLPKEDGISLARKIRNKNEQIPILFLTAKSMKEDVIEGFQVGGDDYITKPFNMDELACRIEVFLKRTSSQEKEEPNDFAVGQYHFDYKNLHLSIDSDERSITQREADVLRYLVQKQSTIVKREELLKKIWGENDYFAGRSMDVFISKLRKYLKSDPNVKIVNYHGVGFKLEVSEV